jgi:hypothetical protein
MFAVVETRLITVIKHVLSVLLVNVCLDENISDTWIWSRPQLQIRGTHAIIYDRVSSRTIPSPRHHLENPVL